MCKNKKKLCSELLNRNHRKPIPTGCTNINIQYIFFIDLFVPLPQRQGDNFQGNGLLLYLYIQNLIPDMNLGGDRGPLIPTCGALIFFTDVTQLHEVGTILLGPPYKNPECAPVNFVLSQRPHRGSLKQENGKKCNWIWHHTN